jgi:hypothetical protein
MPMTFVTEDNDGQNIIQIRGMTGEAGLQRLRLVGGICFGFQGFQIEDRYRTAVDLEHPLCL